MKKRLKRFGGRIRTASMQRIAAELNTGGELGRAIPGGDLAQTKSKVIAKDIKDGESAVPVTKGRTEISTYFTKPSGSHMLYRAESWVRIRLILETAGPVSVGSRDNVAPPLSGKGALLPINVEVTFPMQKGNRIYIAATAVNRVRFIIEPIPWLEQMATMLGTLVSFGGRR